MHRVIQLSCCLLKCFLIANYAKNTNCLTFFDYLHQNMAFFSVVEEKNAQICYGLQQRATAWTDFCSVSCKKYSSNKSARTKLEQTKHFDSTGGKNTDDHEQKARDMKFNSAIIKWINLKREPKIEKENLKLVGTYKNQNFSTKTENILKRFVFLRES